MTKDHLDGQANSHVYYNRTRKIWSVRRNGKVVAHLERLLMIHCTMKVSEKSRLKVLETRKRSVHAWITGTIVPQVKKEHVFVEISYAPFARGFFSLRTDIGVSTPRQLYHSN